jgi:NADPH:quinone reductase-like Zn-dependent oxidoreductase
LFYTGINLYTTHTVYFLLLFFVIIIYIFLLLIIYFFTFNFNVQGQSILIHAGTGGIGQAALHICLQRNLTVFTTCSSLTKRNFLKKNFGLQDFQILSSRDVSFAKKIMELTNNKGVDIVINSLSEEMLIASLNCVAMFGHFCEIGFLFLFFFLSNILYMLYFFVHFFLFLYLFMI